MKVLFVFLVAVIPCNVFACDREAQVSAPVVSTKVEGGTCLVRLGKFSFFNASSVCPLDIDQARKIQFVDRNCRWQKGQEFSGVIVLSEDEAYLDD
jgi:hypothetical protein